MTNFKIEFSVSPWLLFLLIPAFALIFFLYFRMNKKFRKTRNRITAMVLHAIVMTLCILVLAGITFTWTEPNLQSELVILVDSSYTETSAKERVDKFVKDILDANGGVTNLAIVRFGYRQEVVLNMGLYEPEEAYSIYETSEEVEIDDTATDICGALNYCWNPITDTSGGEGEPVIHNPQEARILLLSDGLQTDRDALDLAKRIARDGIRIEVAFLPGQGSTDVWITGVTFPERRYSLGETIEYEVSVNSTYEGAATLTITDSEQETEEPVFKNINLTFGPQTVQFNHNFIKPGFHTIKFELFCEGDMVEQNNVYYTYYDLDRLSKILLLEKYTDESLKVQDLLEQKAEGSYLSKTVIQIDNTDLVPKTAREMAEYDEIVLVNIAHSDMAKIDGFEEELDEYVYTLGGSVFTVGGFERDENGAVIYEEKPVVGGNGETHQVPKPHAYDEDDMKGTQYQKMLPVDITKYTPPVGLVFIIDRSASMENDSTTGGPLDCAIRGAVSTLDVLSPRDYVGVMTLESSSTLALSMTPMTMKAQIVRAIRSIGEGSGGGTAYAPAIRAAQRLLVTFQSADIKHIVLISDGMPADDENTYQSVIRGLAKSDISFTYFSINNNVPAGMDEACKQTGGNAYRITKEAISEELPDLLYEEMQLDEYTGAVSEDFTPEVDDRITSILGKLTQEDLNKVTMHGFFSSKEKGTRPVETVLKAHFVPLYSQWEYGKGKVGSFLCDAQDIWSQEFFASEDVGIPIFNGILDTLMPANLIRQQTLVVNFKEDNYRTQASIYGFEQAKERDHKLIAFVCAPARDGAEAKVDKYDLSLMSTGGNRFTFENHAEGIHKVTIYKVPATFDVFANSVVSADDVPEELRILTNVTYRVFSYSAEFDSYVDPFKEGKELLHGISTREIPEDADPDEKFITDAEALIHEFMEIKYEYDPRPWLLIAAIVLLLLDIAVRKFRFKWPHEIFAKKKSSTVQ